MAETLSIRLEHRDRAVLETAARETGLGLSAFVRILAEKEAHRLRRLAIRAEGDRVVVYLQKTRSAREEVEDYGTPLRDDS